MRVMLVSWEYPPVMVGGLGRHVAELATRLARQGHDVVVVCRRPAGTDASTHPTTDTVIDGVRVLCVAEDPPHLEFQHDLVAWTLANGHAMARAGLELLRTWTPDVVHAHDWLVAHAAITLADAARAPLVATIHATEAGRWRGWLTLPLNRQVHSVEWWLANRADAIITCSRAMRDEVAHLFDVDPEPITVLHNGIDPRGWRVAPADVEAARLRHGAGARLLAFVGRLEWEKGVHDLLVCLRDVRRSHPGARLVVAGAGTMRDTLVEQARTLRVRRAVTFAGHVTHRELAALLAAADAVVLPSRYEPFGIVALEAVAAGALLVTSSAGGLAEIVVDGVTGLAAPPGDVRALATAVRSVLDDPAGARRRAVAAHSRLAAEFDWDTIARATADVYAATRPRPPRVLGRPKIGTGNAFGLAEGN